MANYQIDADVESWLSNPQPARESRKSVILSTDDEALQERDTRATVDALFADFDRY